MKTHLNLIILALLAVKSQTQECQSVLQPSTYAYRSDALENSAVDDTPNCAETDLDGIMYTSCNLPGLILTDTLLGPAQFEADSNSYYHWTKTRTNQILFTFPTNVSVFMLQLHFYTDHDNGIALPKTRLYLVDDSFRVSDTVDESSSSTRSFTIDAHPGESGVNERINVSRRLTDPFQNRTTKILLRIDQDKNALAVSEIRFCTELSPDPSTEGSTVASVPPTTSSQQGPSDHVQTNTRTAQSQATTPVSTLLVVNGQVTLHSSTLSFFSIMASLLFVLFAL